VHLVRAGHKSAKTVDELRRLERFLQQDRLDAELSRARSSALRSSAVMTTTGMCRHSGCSCNATTRWNPSISEFNQFVAVDGLGKVSNRSQCHSASLLIHDGGHDHGCVGKLRIPRKAAKTFRPSMSGMITSRVMAIGRRSLARLSPSRPPAAQLRPTRLGEGNPRSVPHRHIVIDHQNAFVGAPSSGPLASLQSTTSATASGKKTVNFEPLPSSLVTVTSPPII
jgi:hypothetical protein